MPGQRRGGRGLSKRKSSANSQRGRNRANPGAAKYREKARVVGRGKREQVPGVGSWGLWAEQDRASPLWRSDFSLPREKSGMERTTGALMIPLDVFLGLCDSF